MLGQVIHLNHVRSGLAKLFQVRKGYFKLEQVRSG
jgi:hypothetical protein